MSTPSSTVDRSMAGKKRVRSEAQLARKRVRDRETQRVVREKNKEHVTDIETELRDLRARYDSLLARTSHLTQQTATALDGERPGLNAVINTSTPENVLAEHTPLSIGGSGISMNPTGPRDWMTRVLTRQEEQIPYQQVTLAGSPGHNMLQPVAAASDQTSSLRVDWPQTANNVSSSVLGDLVDPFGDESLAFQLRTGAGLYQTIPPAIGSGHDLTSSTLLRSEGERKTVSRDKCTCGLSHKPGTYDHNNSFCVELEVFKLLYDAHIHIASGAGVPRPYPRSPSVANLLLIDIDTNPVTRAIGKLFRTFGSTSPRELADSMAMYFMVYRLLRWRVLPIPETYYDIPEWYRPSELQRNVPHPVRFDIVPWPGLRDALIKAYQSSNMDTTPIARDIGECMTVEWPENEQLLIKDGCTNEVIVNPKFEGHIWKFENWKMRRSWSWKQPRLVDLVRLERGEE